MPTAGSHDLDVRLDAAAAVCARQGAQLTELRRQVLALIFEAERPATAYELLDRLRSTRQNAAPPTIYRALDFLVDQKLVHKIERLNAFIACAEGDHAHAHPVQFLICRTCGTVAELDDPAVTRALSVAAEARGFQPGRAVVELDGTCASCFEAA